MTPAEKRAPMVKGLHKRKGKAEGTLIPSSGEEAEADGEDPGGDMSDVSATELAEGDPRSPHVAAAASEVPGFTPAALGTAQ